MMIKDYWRKLAAATIAMFVAESVLAATPAERREELLKVQELINDPDPLMRIANFEEIIQSKDAFKVEMAIKIAMTSQDASLRSLATRAYFAAFKMVVFDPVLPPDLARTWENAKGDVAARRRLAGSNKSLQTVLFLDEVHGGKIRLLFLDVSPSSNQGKVGFTQNGVKTERQTATYRVLGERIVFTTEINITGYSPSCDFELRGTKDLKISGKMICSHSEVGPIDLESEMF